MTALEFRHKLEERGKLDGCRDIKPEIDTEEQADTFIWTYVQRLLQARRYAPAGLVLWGENLWNVKPECVRRVFKAINENNLVLVQGGGAQSKSYTGIGWTFLDWLADPEFTTVKLISTTGGHAKSNTFSTMKSLHRQAIVPLPGIVRAETIALFESDQRACIAIVKIREGADNSGVLQGFHPLPRPVPNPVFGAASRVRAVIDEAEETPGGVWSGIDNMTTSMDRDSDNVKIFAFYNPKDITSRTAQLAEPAGGWGEFDVETGVRGKDEWTSREKWKVVRLDPKKSENVKERKKLFEGLQTYDGYRKLEEKDGGNSLSYFTFGRGAYPPDSAVCAVVPQRVVNLMRGEFVFTGKTIKLGAADIAIDGRDDAIFSAGRWGKASGFRRLVMHDDESHEWQTVRFPEERDCLQLDQQFALPKGSAEIVGKAIKLNCLKLGIPPEWMMLDATGNGSPVWNYLKIPEVWSPEVKGIDFGQPATSGKILEQDSKTCEEQFEGIHTEVWFALSRWGEFGYFAVSPNVRSDELERQLLGRRYLLGAGEKLRVEKKEIYNKRLKRSPDHADSATILVHCAREGGAVLASMTGVAVKEDEIGEEVGHGHVDTVTWFVDKG